MKLLHKADPNNQLKAWSPPDLESDAVDGSQHVRKQQIKTLFQKDDDQHIKSKSREGRSVLHRQDAGKEFMPWQPGAINDDSDTSDEDEWDFIEIADTPFDSSWVVKSPSIFAKDSPQLERTILESESTRILTKARHQAEEIILAAQSEADDILLNAQSEIDEQKKEGFKKGSEEAHAELADAVNSTKKMVEEVNAWKSELLSQGENILIGMVKDISIKLFGEGMELDENALHANLNRIMENAHGLGALKIFLHPRDARLLDSYWSEQQMLILGEQVKIVPTNNIKPGGCLIKGNMGTVDGRVETQLDAVLKTFDEPAE